jgi:glycogen debranching enzyme
MKIPTADLTVSERDIDRALHIAIGDLVGNIYNYRDGILHEPAPCLFAGRDYDMPWTRDASLNTWFGLGLLCPEVAKNTLLSVLMREPDGRVRIGGQYWDAIIWAQGVWQYYRYTGDRGILELALEAVTNSLAFFEDTEFDPADGLFRGGACFQDGIAAYPDYFAPAGIDYSGIMSWAEQPNQTLVPRGVGIPIKALSTNCLYYRAYEVAGFLAQALGQPADPAWRKKADALRRAINTRFWREQAGTYGHLVDAPDENDDRQEGFGLAFALLFGIADDAQAARIFETVHLTPQGLPCLWPTYDRYAKLGHYGRHSGPIWPQVNAAWALACQARGRRDLALLELKLLTEKACRDSEFVEVYHPDTGLPYGGAQEDGSRRIQPYGVCHRQSWCASGYIAMVVFCLLELDLPQNAVLTPELRAKLLVNLPEIGIRFPRAK